MEEARKLLRESRNMLENARKDLEECQRLQDALLQEQQSVFERKSSDDPPLPPKVDLSAFPVVVTSPVVDVSDNESEQDLNRRPRVASEALTESKSLFKGEKESNPAASEQETLDFEPVDDDSDEEDEPVITSGLNINQAEDQYDAGDNKAFVTSRVESSSPSPSKLHENNDSFKEEADEDDDELEEDEVLLLLPPPRQKGNLFQQQMSMRTLRSPSEVKVGDGEADPQVLAEVHKEEEEEVGKVPKQTLSLLNKRGYLTKLPSTDKAFARSHSRFIILEGSILLYCTSHTSNIPRRMVNLFGARCTLTQRKQLYFINISPMSREMRPTEPKLKLCTKSEQEARDWASSIVNNIQCLEEIEQIRLAERKLGKRKENRRTSHLGQDITEQPRELPKSYYDILGVPPDATSKQIRTTYYQLAQKFHPDKNPDIDTKAFAEIGAAYHVLKDKRLRASYDLCETVKSAFRLGVLAIKHEEDGSSEQMAFFVDRHFENLFWQKADKGSVLKPGYKRVELRYVHRILAGEDVEEIPVEDPDVRTRCLAMEMSPHAKNNLHYATIYLELDTQEARDDMLDGLRVLRCGASMLFQQNLDKMKEEGMR